MALLAGDIGGTKTLLTLFEGREVLKRHSFPSAQYPSLEALVAAFLPGSPRPSRACFGVSGPVVNDTCRVTNLPWAVEARGLEKALSIPKVALVNDFHALAIGITELPESDLVTLNEAPSDPRGPWVVLGAGTGLGEAVVIKTAGGYDVLSSEGGHCDFAPRNALELDLWRFLYKRHGHVSYERVISGPGLAALYDFMREREPTLENPAVRDEVAAAAEGAAAVISSHGLKEDDRLCAQALDLFVAIYGAEAGNLALKVVAPGGVYVAGGIAPKILPKLKQGGFLASFLDKGRLSHLLKATPVKVVVNADAGLLGAAAIASRLA